MNKVILAGRLTKDVEKKTLTSGESSANFALAVPRLYADKKGEKHTDFITCQAYGREADILVDFGRKGRRIGVDGKLRVRTWDDPDGTRHWITEVVVDEVDLTLDDRAETGD